MAGIPAPAIECVVQPKSGFELIEVVRIHAGKTEGSRKQARGFRSKIGTRRVSSSDDQRESPERLGIQFEFLQHDVEGAEFAPMTPEYILALDVERRGIEPVCNTLDFGRRDKQEDSAGINEPAD
jgi:hypothetical protein